jgi:hypothetical protein
MPTRAIPLEAASEKVDLLERAVQSGFQKCSVRQQRLAERRQLHSG